MEQVTSTQTPVPGPPVRTYLLGTAGHIDHGKSSLVQALTGTNPDRLPEEQRRGMTIELGFAHLDVAAPDGVVRFGVIDVPGHERFIRTMVAGAVGIDVALLVVAADDGWMPQTQEHLEILELLGVSRGLIAITKTDGAAPGRIDEIRDDIRAHTAGTAAADWPVVVTSARTGAGLESLRESLRRSVDGLARGGDADYFRMAIDRVFTLKGRGTVVTGSVLSGKVEANQELELLPVGATCRVRGVQSHGELVGAAARGQRAALNLTGIERDAIARGMELGTPGFLFPSRYIDAHVRALPRLERGLISHQKVRLLIGAGESMATLVVIGAPHIAAGASGYVQLRVHRPVVAAFGQRFVLRDETAAVTIGGGYVSRPVATRRRPMQPATLTSVMRAASDDAAVRLDEALRDGGFAPVDANRLSVQAGLPCDAVEDTLQAMTASGELVMIEGRRVHRQTLDDMMDRAAAMLLRHHVSRPGEPGLQRDRLVGWLEARSAPGLGSVLAEAMVSRGVAEVRGPYMAHRDFRPAMSAEDAALMSRIVAEIAEAGFDPPAWEKLRALAGVSRQKSKSLADLAKTDARLVSFAPGRFASREAMERFRAVVAELGAEGRRFKLADVRDRTGQSRRVVQPLLEHLDRIGMTKRVGEERIVL